jgi:predicted HNH restriction endonuclease
MTIDDEARKAKNRESSRRYRERNRDAFNAYHARWRDTHRERYREIHRAYKDRHQEHIARERLAGKQWCLTVAGVWACLRCGEDDPIALDFHHRDPATKVGEVNLHSSRPTAEVQRRLREEIAKCVVLCANCHRKLHVGRWALEA